MPQYYLENSKEVGIEGCLIKNPLTEPISGGNPLPPLVVGSTIAGEMIEKWDRIDFH
jgi:hypothetical protein